MGKTLGTIKSQLYNCMKILGRMVASRVKHTAWWTWHCTIAYICDIMVIIIQQMKKYLPSSDSRWVIIGTLKISEQKTWNWSVHFSSWSYFPYFPAILFPFLSVDTIKMQIDNSRSAAEPVIGRFIVIWSASILFMRWSDLIVSIPLIRRRKLFLINESLIWWKAVFKSKA